MKRKKSTKKKSVKKSTSKRLTKRRKRNPEANSKNVSKGQIIWYKGEPAQILRITPKGPEINANGLIFGTGWKTISLEPPISQKEESDFKPKISNLFSKSKPIQKQSFFNLKEPKYIKWYTYSQIVSIRGQRCMITINIATLLNGHKDEISDSYRFIIDFQDKNGEELFPSLRTRQGIKYDDKDTTLRAALALLRVEHNIVLQAHNLSLQDSYIEHYNK